MAERESKIDFPEDMRIEKIKEGFETSKEVVLNGKGSVDLNLNGVVKIDTSGFQLLAVVCQTLTEQERDFGWSGQENLLETAKHAGFDRVFGWS